MQALSVRGDLQPHPEHDAIDGITYDRWGRMNPHPDFHENHKKPFTNDDLEYLCMFYETDNKRSLAFALGKTEHVLRAKYSKLKSQGLVQYYRDRYLRKLKG